ncbi:ABC transporter ATP-binding protein [Cohnella lubricantis]|uniref:ABC transporter ATP-binding protein n=2 Tax=Cohnella lubricantis TaxID=2163172 RepID=A0A841T8Q4_9BACL|nr:ABC transporter ATP-binding protein [Cohnella lubricantis]MBP2116876.1 ABC-2 type transport system ATP-binding protein [Cohnella lubricantis]
MSAVIEVNHLRKSYGQVKAIDDVSFQIEADKIYGMLGRNGAGKTTLMHILTAQGFATSGDLKVFGEHPYENEKVLRNICFIKESQKYPDTFSVKNVLDVSADFFPKWDRDFANSLIADFQLPLKRNVKKLSRGMLSSLGIVVGLASRAPLTIFDEPYLGLDAVARSLFYDRLLEDYSEHPRTIILSTHLIDEVSRLLEHVIVIDSGKVILDEETDTIRGRAYAVAGAASKVEDFLRGKQVIHREPFGGLLTAAVIGAGDGRDRHEAEGMGLEIQPVSLQQLVVHLSKINQVQGKEGERA